VTCEEDYQLAVKSNRQSSLKFVLKSVVPCDPNNEDNFKLANLCDYMGKVEYENELRTTKRDDTLTAKTGTGSTPTSDIADLNEVSNNLNKSYLKKENCMISFHGYCSDLFLTPFLKTIIYLKLKEIVHEPFRQLCYSFEKEKLKEGINTTKSTNVHNNSFVSTNKILTETFLQADTEQSSKFETSDHGNLTCSKKQIGTIKRS
jgi:hypothetical protein